MCSREKSGKRVLWAAFKSKAGGDGGFSSPWVVLGQAPLPPLQPLIPGTGGVLSVRVRGGTAMTAKAHQTRVLSLKVKAEDGAGEWKDLEVPKAERAGLGQP